jgi:cytochrome P450
MPTSVVMMKRLQEDIDIVVNGRTYRIPASRRISLNLRAYPMDPRFVDDRTSYSPECFLPGTVRARAGTPVESALNHHAFADPFGRGKRWCLGANLAMAEISALVARMIQDYEMLLVDPKAEWRPESKLMLKADPYSNMKLTRRVWS